MKTRLKDNKPFGNFNSDWIFENKNKIIGGQLVYEWELVTLYDKDYINPFWNGSEWIESATQEEIEAYQRSLIPSAAKNMKFRLALIKSGISLKTINDTINSMPDGVQKEQIQTLWEFADFFERDDKTLKTMAIQLGFTNEQLDNLFILSNNGTV